MTKQAGYLSLPDNSAPFDMSDYVMVAAELWSRAKILLNRRALRGSPPALIVLAGGLGLIVGAAVVVMRHAVGLYHDLSFGLPFGTPLSGGTHIDPLRVAIVPAAGGLAVGLIAWMIRVVRPRDVVDPVEANALHGGRMSLTDSIYLSIVTLISNSAGASLGMEAAYTQTGSAIMSHYGHRLKLRREDMRIFVASGTAAAIAGAFNAPLAGAFYAFELVLGGYNPAALAPVAVSALAGTLVTRLLLGSDPIFEVQPSVGELPHWVYLCSAVLGLFAGGIGIVAMLAVTWCERLFRRLPAPAWSRPVIGGFILSALAMAVPQVLGAGHGAIQHLFDNDIAVLPLLLMLVAKIAGSAISIGSGFRGGLFSSSLLIGCLFGGVASAAAALIVPSVAAQHLVLMMVGMGAVAAAIVGAPITMVLLVLEITGDFAVALSVLAGVVTSATLVRQTFGYSFSTWRFHQRGVAIRSAHDVGWMSDLSVGRMMHVGATTVRDDLPLLAMRASVPYNETGPICIVTAAEQTYVGMVEAPMIHDPDLDDAAAGLVAGDLAGGRDYYLTPAQSVRAALARFAETETEMLPVIADNRRVIGYLTEAHALRAYAEGLERNRNAELGDRDLFSRA